LAASGHSAQQALMQRYSDTNPRESGEWT
jgi:hypothetical protein